MKKHPVAAAVQAALDAERRVERDNPPAALAEEPRSGQNPATAAVQPPLDGECWVGIDVAKAHLDVATWPAQERLRVLRDKAGLAELTGWLHARSPRLIILEVTGGLETAVAAALVEAHLLTAVINPRQARDFAKALGVWPRPTPWMPWCWPALATRSSRRPAPGRTRRPKRWRRCSSGGARWSRC